MLTEWFHIDQIRPLPPPVPAGFLQRLTAGATLDMLFEDGWWEVEFVKSQPSPLEYLVQAHGLRVAVLIALTVMAPLGSLVRPPRGRRQAEPACR